MYFVVSFEGPSFLVASYDNQSVLEQLFLPEFLCNSYTEIEHQYLNDAFNEPYICDSKPIYEVYEIL